MTDLQNHRKGNQLSILKTSKTQLSPYCVDHHHNFIQSNLTYTAKDNYINANLYDQLKISSIDKLTALRKQIKTGHRPHAAAQEGEERQYKAAQDIEK